MELQASLPAAAALNGQGGGVLGGRETERWNERRGKTG